MGRDDAKTEKLATVPERLAWGGSNGSQGNVDQPFMFTGREFDRTTGLQYNRARWLDSGLGRWNRRDPIALVCEPNSYWYVSNEPNNLTDPNGLQAISREETQRRKHVVGALCQFVKKYTAKLRIYDFRVDNHGRPDGPSSVLRAMPCSYQPKDYRGEDGKLHCAHFDPDWPPHLEVKTGSIRIFPRFFKGTDCQGSCGSPSTLLGWSQEDQRVLCAILHEVGHAATGLVDEKAANDYAEPWYQAIREKWNGLDWCVGSDDSDD